MASPKALVTTTTSRRTEEEDQRGGQLVRRENYEIASKFPLLSSLLKSVFMVVGFRGLNDGWAGWAIKGQIISKRVLVSPDSSKKRTNKFVFLA